MTMKRGSIASSIACLTLCLAGNHSAYADLVAVAGPASSLGALPLIIAPPSDVLNQCVTASGQLGFEEAQGVVTPVAFSADDAVVIPAGTLVDSHLILLNIGVPGGASHTGVVWTFKRPIIAVMSNPPGTLEAASTPALGAPGTNYSGPPTAGCVPFGPTGAAPFGARGLETTLAAAPFTHTVCPAVPTNDCYTVAGNQILVGMFVSQPGDWIRVVTQGAINVAIDIKPGSDPNCINPNNNGVIPAAILGSATFDVTQINTSTLTLAGLPVALRGNGTPQCSIQNVNGDAFNDMVCQFTNDPSAWSSSPATAELTGSLLNGFPFEGSDAVCLVP